MIKWINKKRNKKGFTLVELVVVVAILGILVALAVPRLLGSREKAAINAHNSNVRMIEGAMQIYEAEYGENTTLSMAELKEKDLLKDDDITSPKGSYTGNNTKYTIDSGVVKPIAVPVTD